MKNKFQKILLITISGLIFVATGFAQNSDELMSHAKTLIENKDFTAAIQILNDFIKIIPNNGNAYQLRGDAYRLRGYTKVNLEDLQNSKNDYTHAINLGTKNSKVYENRSDLSWLSNTPNCIDKLS